jgi:membrane associated rhomboid family serine protease
MTNSIVDEIRESFRHGSALTKLIYINLGVFLIVKIAFVFFFLLYPDGALGGKAAYFNSQYLSYLMISSDLNTLLLRPWTPFTYMFLHFGFLHIIFNVLVLFWFGRIFLQYLNQKQLLTTYLLGGLFGAALFVAAYSLFPGLNNGIALGASASVMAIVIAISFYVPDYTIYIPIVGPVKLKYVALFYIGLDVLQIASENAGGHIAHLGGAFYGYIFALQMKRGKDTGKRFSAFFDSLATLFSRKPRMKVSYKSQAKTMTDLDYNKSKAETQKEVDVILDKIAKSGYNSLSKSEKEMLFKVSGKN